MNPFPMKHSVLIMDNVEFHHTYIKEIKSACHAKGVLVLFLPIRLISTRSKSSLVPSKPLLRRLIESTTVDSIRTKTISYEYLIRLVQVKRRRRMPSAFSVMLESPRYLIIRWGLLYKPSNLRGGIYVSDGPLWSSAWRCGGSQ